MVVPKAGCVGVLAFAALVLGLAAPAGACAGQVGEEVVLASISPDPDVFVWDNRGRLTDYAAGIFSDAKSVMAHTMLMKPGTRAMVTDCHSGEIHQKYIVEPLDAVGVKIVSGPLTGKLGWVTSEDVHPLRGARAPVNAIAKPHST